MRKIYDILTLLLAATLLASCAEETFPGIEGGGDPVTISLGYRQSAAKDMVMTRSAATDGEDNLANLQVFAFSKDGTLVGYKWISSGLKQDGTVGGVEMKVVPGDCYFYGVANVLSNAFPEYSITEGTIPRSSGEAADSKWSDAYVTGGYSALKLDDLKSIQFTRNTGMEISSSFLMSGVMNDGNLVRIATDGSLTPLDANGNAITTEGADIIRLRRVVSKITVNITEGADRTSKDDDGNTVTTEITFQPTSCQIVNIPKLGNLIEASGSDAEITNNTYTSINAEFFDNTASEATKKTYSITNCYLPENLQERTQKRPLHGWSDRETDNGGDDNDATTKYFTNAPEHSTYLVITGSYSEKANETVTAEATPVYYIHLGEFGEDDWTDFNVERNCDYTYDITVNGVSSITAEVAKESVDQTNGSVEGISISLQSGSKVFDLDSHYGQLNFSFDQDCVVYDGTSSDTKEYYVYFFSKDIRKTSPVLKLYKNAAGETLKVAQQSGANTWVDISGDEVSEIRESTDWVKCMKGIGDDKKGEAYPGKDSKNLIDLFTLIDTLIEKKIKNINDSGETDWTANYTCFVDENYYEDMLWSEFVNTTPRYAYICRNLNTSHDLRSISGAVIYGVTQKSIQTVYNLDNAATIDAFGVETNVSDNYGNRSSNSEEYTDTDGRLTVESRFPPTKGSASSDWDGYANYKSTLAQAGYATWSRLAETTKWTDSDGNEQTERPPYTTAIHSCMSRNRDLDGDGTIDEDEIRWYAPTIKQYEGLFVGQRALDSDARLYKGKTSELTEDADMYREKGYHYWANIDASVSVNNIFWAEEGMATSAYWSGGVPEYFVACVRNLPADKKTVSTTPADFFNYDSDSRTVKLSDELDANSVRSTVIDGELIPHTESDENSYVNKPAKSFYIAEGFTTETTSPQETTEGTPTICANYHEDGDGGATWRAPNLMELAIIYLALPSTENITTEDINSFCRTKYSNTDFRYTWAIGVGDDVVSLRMIGKSGEYPQPTSGGYRLRCVRDADSK